MNATQTPGSATTAHIARRCRPYHSPPSPPSWTPSRLASALGSWGPFCLRCTCLTNCVWIIFVNTILMTWQGRRDGFATDVSLLPSVSVRPTLLEDLGAGTIFLICASLADVALSWRSLQQCTPGIFFIQIQLSKRPFKPAATCNHCILYACWVSNIAALVGSAWSSSFISYYYLITYYLNPIVFTKKDVW